jgi:hypothetical protein
MLASSGRFARIRNKLPYVATVDIEVDESTPETSVQVACHGRGFVGHGYIEDVPAHGYEVWKKGAIVGVEYALKQSGKSGRVVITRIQGTTTETNPTIVGAAAIDALWKAFAFEPSDELRTHIEEIVFNSWAVPYDSVPVL